MVLLARLGRKVPLFRERIAHWWDPPRFSMSGVHLLVPDVSTVQAFQTSLASLAFSRSEVVLYYPGCGTDLVWPLAILQAVASNARSWHLVLQDPDDDIGPIVGAVQMLTSVIPHKRAGQGAVFKFKDKALCIDLHQTDATLEVPLDNFHIYLDRAFEIVRCKEPGFLENMARCLCPGGLAFTDAAFPKTQALRRLGVRLPNWGFYKVPAVYLKISENL